MKEKAVILLSGGLDSTTCLAIAHAQHYECHSLSINYSQTNSPELNAARRLASAYSVARHHEITCDMSSFQGSALTDSTVPVPDHADTEASTASIPTTYVPARNTIFLSIALGVAEVIGSRHLFIGVNAVDYSGYPDCRPEYIQAFSRLANLATKAAVEGNKLNLHTPLLDLSKAAIIQKGIALGVDYGLTVSCYRPTEEGLACGQCDSCHLRREGFLAAGVSDPTRYK